MQLNNRAVAPQPLIVRVTTSCTLALGSNGDFASRTRAFQAADAMWATELGGGCLGFKKYGLGKDVIAVAPSGKLRALRFVGGDWRDSTARVAKRAAAQAMASAKVARWRRIWPDLWRRHCQISWISAEHHPYEQLFELTNNGAVNVLGGAPLAAADTPVALANGLSLSRLSASELLVHGPDGAVIDRFRFDGAWKRLVTLLRVPGFPIADLHAAPGGLEFHHPDAPVEVKLRPQARMSLKLS